MDNDFYTNLISNIVKIMRDRQLTQATVANYLKTSPSQFSKILKGDVKLSFTQLSNLATHLSMPEIDIITYPDKYYKHENAEPDQVEAILQIKLKKDKKDQVLRMVFGDNNVEILNK